MTFPTREQLINAIAKATINQAEYSISPEKRQAHLRAQRPYWNDVAEAALNGLITALPDPSYVYVSRMEAKPVGDTYVTTLLEKKVANFGEQYYKQLLAMGENNV